MHRHSGGPVLTQPGGQLGQRILGATPCDDFGAAEVAATSATQSAASNMGSFFIFITRSFRMQKHRRPQSD
jgi:hypothetical protein